MNNRTGITGWNWGKVLMDILKTFIGVLLAFWVGEWTADRDFRQKQRYLLVEIQHELELNLADLRLNLGGHEYSINMAKSFRSYLAGTNTNLDTLPMNYLHLLRDFASIQHTAAYETMKARGLESIKNDSLRYQIADLYDFEFETVEKMEEEYAAHEFFEHYNQPMLQILSKCYDFSGTKPKGQRALLPFTALPKQEKNLMYAWLQKLTIDRDLSVRMYKEVIGKGEKVMEALKKELGG